ncbi:MAG: RES family NAD+ phosphorylase [Mangrovicoccus sp.]|nr:RES family NAD+ phosphorylase [Mangrovicoccus sp.]
MRLTDLRERGLVRLISHTHHKPPVLRALVDDEAEAAILAGLEGETSARLVAEREGGPALDRRELAFRRHRSDLDRYGHTHVNAAFAYTRPEGNRFNAGDRGAWYCAFDDLTACHEVGYHRTRELRNVGRLHDSAVYVALLADFIGEFPDLRGVVTPALDPDPGVGYPAGQAFARDLRAAGHGGLIYPSARSPGGTCFVAFVPQIVQNVRPGAKWTLTWRGGPDFEIASA